MKTPTFLVYTMWCGEPDFEKCRESIVSQKDVIVKHVVVKNKRELEAHIEVYSSFNTADPTLYRAKIDADVVLNDGVLRKLYDTFREKPQIDWIDPAVHDFLTDHIIHAGIAVFSSRVRFTLPTNPLKCDKGVVNTRHPVLNVQEPVGLHMHHCDERTAFRYGLHRGLKGQTPIEALVRRANEMNPDPRRLAAIRGFETARSEKYVAWHESGGTIPNDHNYEDDEFIKSYQV